MRRCTLGGLVVFAAALVIVAFATPAGAQAKEFRAFWADAFHTGFRTPAECDKLLADARAANCNALIVQFRRRGDTYFPSSYEPFASDANPNFDALAYLIDKAHNGTPRMEIHAWLCTLPIWNSSTLPSNPYHPANRFPQFLTKNAAGDMWDGSGYVFDPGHPGALDYTTNVYLDVVRRYDVDGIHYDYVRFYGVDRGYNDVSVARFLNAYPNKTLPLDDYDPDWLQWRRDQVTSLVRRTYAKALAINPNIKVSGSTITWGDGPTTENGWYWTSAYSSILQDWRSWMEEGILDINVPMTYYREYSNAEMYDHWVAYEKDHKYGRQLAVGPGIYLNSIVDSISQIREIRTPTDKGNVADGISMYSYAVNSLTESNADFLAALVDPTSPLNGGDPPFPTPVETPPMPWKTSPDAPGHLAGSVTSNGMWIDRAIVHLTGKNLPPEGRVMRTDGTGYYAFISIPAGKYDVSIDTPYGSMGRQAKVDPHQVTTVNFDIRKPVKTTISHFRITKITTSSILVAWDTDTPATCQLRYGLTPALGNATEEYCFPETSHTSGLWNLQPSTAYYFQAVSNGKVVSPIYCAVTGTDGVTIYMDNTQGTALPDDAAWTTGTSSSDKYLTDYRYIATAGTETARFEWRPNIPRSGNYTVSVWYPKGGNRSTQSPFTIYYDGGSLTATVNQQQNGGKWNRITPSAGVPFKAGTAGYVALTNAAPTGKLVMADGVRFTLVSESNPPTPPTNLMVTDIGIGNLTLAWDPSTDDTGMAGYKIYRDGFQIGATTDTSFTDAAIAPGVFYLYTVRAYDVFGNESADSNTADTWTYSAPSKPLVMGSGPSVSGSGGTQYTLSRSQFCGTWSSSDPYGIAQYEYAVGTTPGGTDLVSWTRTKVKNAVVNVPDQPYGTRVFFAVRAQSKTGLWSEIGYSDGVTVARGVTSIAEAKALPDGSAVIITRPKQVTAAFPSFFYVQEKDGVMGIRVEGVNASPGSRVMLAGVLSRTYRERVLAQTEVNIPSLAASSTETIVPLGMSGRMLGGSDLMYDPSTDAGQCGTYAWQWVKIGNNPPTREMKPVGGSNNLGILVKTWGKVSWSGNECIYVDDGSGFDDFENTTDFDDQASYTGSEQSGPPGIKVILQPGSEPIAKGSYVSVVGAVSCYTVNGVVKRALCATGIMVLREPVVIPPPPPPPPI